MATISEALTAAVKYHQQGNLREAERLYREILQRDARHADAWHLLGLVAYARRDFQAAVEHIGQAIEIDPAPAAFHNHLAEAYLSLARLSEAEASCRQALERWPDFAIAHNTLGTIKNAQGELEQAKGAFARAIELKPDLAQAHFNLGLALETEGRVEEAMAGYRRAISVKPDYALAYERLGTALRGQQRLAESVEAYRSAVRIEPGRASAQLNLGALLQSQARLDEAIECYRKALAVNPQDAKAHSNLGSALHDQGRTAEAIESFRHAIELAPGMGEAPFNLGVVLQEQGALEEAAECYRAALRAAPDSAKAHNNLGTVYRLQGKLHEAAECFQRALEHRPDLAEVLTNLGNIFKLQGRHAEAVICYNQTLRMLPDHALAHTNRALSRLAEGDFAAGWPEFEWRWKNPGFPKHTHEAPQWDGSPLGDRTLLVHAEQGLGDTLQFIRYLPLVTARGSRVVIEVMRQLAPLLEQSGFGGLVAKGSPLPAFDVQIPLLSLPGIFGTTLATIPRDVPYLSADPKLVEHWRDVLRGTGTFKVGIAWQGSSTYLDDRYRSIPLRHFALLEQPTVELVSLQKGPGSEQLTEAERKFGVRDFGDALDRHHGAFMDTAAIMMNLDLVVTSDTATAHLAGALGVPVWVALSYAPDWRWMLDRDDSPWYPTMRLFRQTTFDDWPGVFTRMAAELRRLAGQRE